MRGSPIVIPKVLRVIKVYQVHRIGDSRVSSKNLLTTILYLWPLYLLFRELTYPPDKACLNLFPKVGYVSFLEGIYICIYHIFFQVKVKIYNSDLSSHGRGSVENDPIF